MMSRPLFGALAAAILTLASLPASAVLKVGDRAPVFDADAALGGQSFKFSLAQSLKKGPVVLYFYPKAFTSGCTVEAHEFAEATERFTALGATVVGMSNDNIDTLKKFSVEVCRNKFAVAADDGGKVIRQYDVALSFAMNMADRVSYVISPQGEVIYAYASSDPSGHITNTLKAVERWKASSKP